MKNLTLSLVLGVSTLCASSAHANTFDLGYGFTCGTTEEFEETVMTSNGVIAKGFALGGSIMTNTPNTEQLLVSFQAVNGSEADRDVFFQLVGLVAAQDTDGKPTTSVGFAFGTRLPIGLKAGADGGYSDRLIIEAGVSEKLTNVCWRFDVD